MYLRQLRNHQALQCQHFPHNSHFPRLPPDQPKPRQLPRGRRNNPLPHLLGLHFRRIRRPYHRHPMLGAQGLARRLGGLRRLLQNVRPGEHAGHAAVAASARKPAAGGGGGVAVGAPFGDAHAVLLTRSVAPGGGIRSEDFLCAGRASGAACVGDGWE